MKGTYFKLCALRAIVIVATYSILVVTSGKQCH